MANPNPTQGTRFRPGQSGNPSGRPKGLTAREALRRALVEPGKDGKVPIEKWAADLAATTDAEMRLSILKFLEGNQPPPDVVVADVDAAEDQVNGIRKLVADIKAEEEGEAEEDGGGDGGAAGA